MLQACAQAVDFKVGHHFGEGQGIRKGRVGVKENRVLLEKLQEVAALDIGDFFVHSLIVLPVRADTLGSGVSVITSKRD
jgi:hypothetical protein